MDPISGEGDVADLEARRRASSIEDRAADGEAEDGAEPDVPAPPPLPGDKQLSLPGLAPRGTPIEATVSVMSKAFPITGLLDPAGEQTLVIRVIPAGYNYVPVRENGEVVRFKLVQQVRIVHAVRADTEAGGVAAAGA